MPASAPQTVHISCCQTRQPAEFSTAQHSGPCGATCKWSRTESHKPVSIWDARRFICQHCDYWLCWNSGNNDRPNTTSVYA